MKEATTLLALAAVCLLCSVGRCLSAPGRAADEVLIGEVDIAMRDAEDDEVGAADGVDSPEITTEEAFAKRCIVEDKAYAHSQMIPSRDQSSHCLCVAGEVYCWWQTYGAGGGSSGPSSAPDESDSWTTEEDDYSGAVAAAAAARASDAPAAEASGDSSGERQDNNASAEEEEDDDEDVEEEEVDEDEEEEEEDNGESLESNDLPEASPLNATASTSATTSTSTTTTTTASTTTTTTQRSTRAPATCLVMGRKYQEGEVLPHSTGNCVECSCGTEGRIECSPRDCVGLRPQSPGGGDLELFELDRPGIEGTF